MKENLQDILASYEKAVSNRRPENMQEQLRNLPDPINVSHLSWENADDRPSLIAAFKHRHRRIKKLLQNIGGEELVEGKKGLRFICRGVAGTDVYLMMMNHPETLFDQEINLPSYLKRMDKKIAFLEAGGNPHDFALRVPSRKNPKVTADAAFQLYRFLVSDLQKIMSKSIQNGILDLSDDDKKKMELAKALIAVYPNMKPVEK